MRRFGSLAVAGAMVLCSCMGGSAPSEPVGVAATLPLPGGQTLKLWRPGTGDAFDIYVPGFDQVDFVRGNTIIIRDSETGLLRRDVYLGSGSASVGGHLSLTYGYSPARLRGALDHGRPSSQPRWVTAALRRTATPVERATERHYGRDLAALTDALGARAPCADPAYVGLPLASLSTMTDWTRRVGYNQRGVDCVYSKNLVDAARASTFVTESAFPIGSRAARDSLDHVRGGTKVSAGGLVGRIPRGDLTDMVVRLRGWVVVMSRTSNGTTDQWRRYLRGLAKA